MPRGAMLIWGSAEYLRFRRGVSVKSRLFVNAFDEQIRSFFLESNQKLGVLRGLFGFGGASESWVPSPEGCLKVMVEHVGSHLQKQMRAARGPSHLLLLDEALGK